MPLLWATFVSVHLAIHRSRVLIFAVGLGYLKVFVPPEKVLRCIEGKLNLLGRLPHYISVDQKTFGRYGVLPTSNAAANANGTPMSYMSTNQRLGA